MRDKRAESPKLSPAFRSRTRSVAGTTSRLPHLPITLTVSLLAPTPNLFSVSWMAKATEPSSRKKGQKTLASFFGGGAANKAKAKAPKVLSDEEEEFIDGEDGEGSGGDSSDAVMEEEDVSEEEAPKAKGSKAKATAPPKTKRQGHTALDLSLPPIHDIPEIFSDLVGRVPDLKNVAEHIHGRKLRVATMCSGTESPLLALGLICESVKEHYDVALEVEHVFSCEIEPFKQAYIERNFQPPLLFRDVCELGQSHAYAFRIL
jgi:hypothetical protein